MSERTCNRRDLEGGVLRCEREQGHSGAHGATSFHGHERTWPNLSEPKAKAQRKRSRLPRTSPKQKTRKQHWAFIKKCMVLAQRRTNGYTSCMQCGAINPPNLQLDHIDASGHGGIWEPENAQLLCSGPGSCHERKHGRVEWTKGATA